MEVTLSDCCVDADADVDGACAHPFRDGVRIAVAELFVDLSLPFGPVRRRDVASAWVRSSAGNDRGSAAGGGRRNSAKLHPRRPPCAGQ
jgi:hypothetical protein